MLLGERHYITGWTHGRVSSMDAYLTPASPDLDTAAMDTADAWISSQRVRGFKLGGEQEEKESWPQASELPHKDRLTPGNMRYSWGWGELQSPATQQKLEHPLESNPCVHLLVPPWSRRKGWHRTT